MGFLIEINHYQSSRVMDDFYVPRKHNFHPKDIIHDINLLGGEVYNFDNDLRDYNHEGENMARCNMMGGWIDLQTRKLRDLPNKLFLALNELEKTGDFKNLTKDDTRKFKQFPQKLI